MHICEADVDPKRAFSKCNLCHVAVDPNGVRYRALVCRRLFVNFQLYSCSRGTDSTYVCVIKLD